ncbi:MAG TPA: hypothetical protein VGP55_04825 [Chitinophagaceae bacterium]|nr:hypothetical protein [Chitinophagaceae bacterium]
MTLRLTCLFTITCIIFSCTIKAQLTVNASDLFMQTGATITVQGNVTGNANIPGTGTVLLKGTINQNITMNGFTIPLLEINNVAGATLTGNTRIGTSLTFTNGKIKTGNFNFTLADVATTAGSGTSKFIETTGTGQVFKEVTSNLSSIVIPLGAGTSYRPALLTTSGTYSNAKIGVRVLATANPNKPPKISDYILAYWPVTKTGITGTVTVAGQYIDAADISGTEANLRGYYFNGTDWSSASETHNTSTNQVSAPITAASGELTALDKFDLLKARAFLQGAYNSTLGLMNDALRTPTNLIPLSDPYRTAPYNTSFTHLANTITEVAPVSVFNNQASANDNIVDWVFVELRNGNVSSGNPVLQTRSALIQRDGDIVDIDGISPVTFNNVPSTNYTIAVRHRNHLGLCTYSYTLAPLLGEVKSTASLVDFTTATDAQLFGTSNAYTVSSDGKNLLWGGNANMNNKASYINPANDKDYILSTILGGNSAATVNGYNQGDINFDHVVKFTGPGNDKDYLLSAILNGSSITVRTQQLPTGQPTDFYTTFPSGTFTSGALVHLPGDYYSSNNYYQAIIFFTGKGQVGTDTSLIAVYGPHDYLRAGWDGGVQVANGTYYPIIISIQLPAYYKRPYDLKILLDNIQAAYRIQGINLTGLSMGGWEIGIFVTYQPTAGDHTYQNYVQSIVALSPVTPSDTYDATPAYPDRFADFAAAGGKAFFTNQSVNDVSNVSNIPPVMNAVVANSASFELTTNGSGGHCCWEYEYGGNGYPGPTVRTPRTHNINGVVQNIYQFMLSTGNTTIFNKPMYTRFFKSGGDADKSPLSAAVLRSISTDTK